MKILFLTEYFFPFIHGGAETSIELLGETIASRGHKVFLLTPNFGAKTDDKVAGIRVHRYPFPKKLKKVSDQLTPFWFFNPVFWLYQLLIIVTFAKKNKIQLIHVQSQYSIIAGVIASRILKIPSVITFRDDQILCNYGVCLGQSQFSKTCSLWDYFFSDFRRYYEDKVNNKSLPMFWLQLSFACYGRLRTDILKLFAKLADARVCSSNAQARTFKMNGFQDINVIYNLYKFPMFPPSREKVTEAYILFATKISSGKGFKVLLEAFSLITEKFPRVRLIAAGQGDIDRYKNFAQSLNILDKVDFLGWTEREEYRNLRRKALLEITPSIYPESFGRAALESIANGTPVIASSRGGLAEIVEDGLTGYIVEPRANLLAETITRGIKNNRKLRENIRLHWSAFKLKFQIEPTKKYLTLYKLLS